MKTIIDEVNRLKDRIEKLAYAEHKQSDCYWISEEVAWSPNETHIYCKMCANEVLDYLTSNGKFPVFAKHGGVTYIENAVSVDKDDIYLCHECNPLSDSTEFCYLCTEKLSTALTEYGLMDELEHFEEIGIEADTNLWYIFEICQALQYAKQDQLNQSLDKIYTRVLELLMNYKDIIGGFNE